MWAVNDVLIDPYPFIILVDPHPFRAIKGYGSTEMIKGHGLTKTSLTVHTVSKPFFCLLHVHPFFVVYPLEGQMSEKSGNTMYSKMHLVSFYISCESE